MTKPIQPRPAHDLENDRESATPETPRRPRTPEELHEFSINWVRKTGWPTRKRDAAIARGVYEKWIAASHAEFAVTRSRNFEVLADMLRDAFVNLHDEEGVDSLQILFTLELSLRGRREGKLHRHTTH